MADPRETELWLAANALFQTGHCRSDQSGPLEWRIVAASMDRLRAALDAAALSASPPARVGVPVRVAVGLQTVVEAGMERDWGIYKLRGDEPDESAWAYLNSIGYAFRAAILTATIQPPVVAEIAAAVEKP